MFGCIHCVITCPDTAFESESEHFQGQWIRRSSLKTWPPQSFDLILLFVSNGLHKPSGVKSENQQHRPMKLKIRAAVETVYNSGSSIRCSKN